VRFYYGPHHNTYICYNITTSSSSNRDLFLCKIHSYPPIPTYNLFNIEREPDNQIKLLYPKIRPYYILYTWCESWLLFYWRRSSFKIENLTMSYYIIYNNDNNPAVMKLLPVFSEPCTAVYQLSLLLYYIGRCRVPVSSVLVHGRPPTIHSTILYIIGA